MSNGKKSKVWTQLSSKKVKIAEKSTIIFSSFSLGWKRINGKNSPAEKVHRKNVQRNKIPTEKKSKEKK